MPAPVPVLIHPSQFPQNVLCDLLDSLRARRINHKFHYDSIKQTQKWLALFQAYSPFVTDPACAAIYDRAFAETARRLEATRVHLISLGCGGGQKDVTLLRRLQEAGMSMSYTPCDVAPAMTLMAHQLVTSAFPGIDSRPFVCDLATATDLPEALGRQVIPGARPLIALFGIIPNFKPDLILPRLAGSLKVGGFIILSANLVSDSDYEAGMQKILPLYDNELTRDWLFTFLSDLGVANADGDMRFRIEEDAGSPALKRIVADFVFSQPRDIQVGGERFVFSNGETIRLFFSYRYTPDLLRSTFSLHGLELFDQWITPSEEEGVFLCRWTE